MRLRGLVAPVILLCVAVTAGAQSQTTGQISGTAADASGAVIPGAQVTVVNSNTGLTRTTQSNAEGLYVVPLLDVGNYTVTITVKGFQTVRREGITVAIGHSALVDFRLQVGGVEEKVTVSTEAPLIEPSNPNTTTTFNASQLASIPNPGNDLSYVANLAPGAVMNTADSSGRAGTGNTEFNGLGSLANDFTVDGLDANNVGLNTNFPGASGLQLGLNAIQEVSVNTVAYSVAGGRSSGSQIDFVTKSGTNDFHGNVFEIWNGSAMNANNFFLNDVGARKPRSNVNEFGASLGGPILKNKLFVFTDVEGIRLVLPVLLSSTLPTPAYQSYVLQQLPLGGTDTVLGNQLPPQPAEVPFYQNMFALMGDTSRGNPLAVLGCPLNADGSPAGGSPPDGDGCAKTRTFSASPPADETLFTIKLDYNPNPKDTFWFRFQLNNGSKNQVDPVNSAFDITTPVPHRQGSAGWTHVFNSNLVNQFNPGLSYVSIVNNETNPAKAQAALPISYDVSPFSSIGGFQFTVPSGFAPTIWQLNDNLAWTRSKHSFQFGENLRRALSSSYPGIGETPFEIGCSLPEFTFGATCETIQAFNKSGLDRLKSVNFDVYAMDTFKATDQLTVTAGLRAAWNSDPISEHKLFSRLSGPFGDIEHDVNRPLNLDVLANQRELWGSTPLLQWQPRVAFACAFAPKTVLRAGFGVFANPPDQFESIVNPPASVVFNAGLFTPIGGITIAPGVPNSAVDAAVAANEKFQTGFASGALSCASTLAPPTNCIAPFTFNDVGPGRHDYPYSLEWSSGIERELGNNFLISGKYIGTRGIKGFINYDVNGYQTTCQGCFAPLPFNTPADPRFGEVFSYGSGANSSYHALQISAEKHMTRGLAFLVNYTFSHCIDDISNGGSFAFNANSRSAIFPGELERFHGNCDYDVRHSVNGSYVYELPFHSRRSWLRTLVEGWQVAGTFFLRDGFPFSISSASLSSFVQASPFLFASAVPGQSFYSKQSIPGVTQPGTIQWLNPNAFQSVVDTSTNTCFPTTDPQDCQQGNLARNAVRGPSFRWFDLEIAKRFRIREGLSFKFSTQFYNLFNHPNFGLPNAGGPVAGIPGELSTLTNFGTISSTVSPNTGLLGSGLGGDSSVRMIALKGTIEF